MTLRIFILFLSLTQWIHGNCGEAFHLTPQEIVALELKVQKGDAAAAYCMWTYHSMSSGDETEAKKWLRTAARLGHPEAQRWLAYEIKEYHSSFEGFGQTPEAAVESLLQKASSTSGTAANDLRDYYREGYLKPKDRLAKARAAYSLAASLHNTSSWQNLAKMLNQGEGGLPDQPEAYYYIVLSTQCIHALSITGKELWKLRQKIEKRLTVEQMEKIWARADIYLSKERRYSGGELYPPALGGTGGAEKQWKKWLQETNANESQHRKTLKEGKPVHPTLRPEANG